MPRVGRKLCKGSLTEVEGLSKPSRSPSIYDGIDLKPYSDCLYASKDLFPHQGLLEDPRLVMSAVPQGLYKIGSG